MELNKIDFKSGELDEFLAFEDAMTEPVGMEVFGLTVEKIARMAGRGLALRTICKSPGEDDRQAMTYIEIIPGSVAHNLSKDLSEMEDGEAFADTFMRFVREALHEQDEDSFKAHWIQYY